MNVKAFLGFLVTLALVAMIAVSWLRPSDDEPAEVEDPFAELTRSWDESPDVPADTPDDDRADPEPSRREASIDSLIARGHGNPDYREALIAADTDQAWQDLWVQFEVIPNTYTRHPRTSCQYIENADGGSLCWDDYGFHPYLTMPVEDLRIIGDTDPAAAEALSILLPRDARDERMFYALQASYLSGKSGPLHRFATLMPASTNDLEARLDRYALFRLGDYQGTPIYRARELELALQRDLEMTNAELRQAARERLQDLFDRAKRARWGR